MDAPRPLPLLLRLLRGRRHSVALLLTAAGLAGAAAARAAEPADPAPAPARKLVAPVATRTVSPVHPLELLKELVSGEAVVECLVGETGAVVDARAASATRPEFGEAAVTAVRQWEFKPGSIEGKPAALRVRIPFDFSLPIDQVINRMAGRLVYQEITDPIIPAQELAAWPIPFETILPRYPKELEGSGKYGKAVVSIVINKEGLVMNPKIVKATYPEFELPALLTAAKLKFPPQVMANRERINVSLDLQFDFKSTTRPAAAPPAGKARPETAKKD